MKKNFTAIFLFSVIFLSVWGQDIHFSQYNLTPMIVNPAQAGAYKNLEFIGNYKTQWTSISPNGYKTMMFSYDGRLMQKKWQTSWLATGFNIYSDKAGDGNLTTTQATASIGYHTMLNDKNILGGCLFGGYSQRKIDYSSFMWEDQYVSGAFNPNASSNENLANNKFGYPDLGLGVLYQFNKGQAYSKDNDMVIIHAGFAIDHLNQPTYNFISSGEKLYTKITGHVDALIGIKKTKFAFMPGFIYMSQGPALEILPGSYFRYMISESTGKDKGGSSIMVGTYLRVKDAFIPSVQFEYAEYTIGVSYDVNVSNLNTATSGKGGFEISLRYGIAPTSVKTSASFN